MKKIKHLYYCDKCGEYIQKGHEHPLVVFPSGRYSTSRTLHLCPTCQKEIEKQLNHFNEFKEE